MKIHYIQNITMWKSRIYMCIHLIELDNYLKNKLIKELFRGQVWSKNCNEWVYYDCILNIKKIEEKI